MAHNKNLQTQVVKCLSNRNLETHIRLRFENASHKSAESLQPWLVYGTRQQGTTPFGTRQPLSFLFSEDTGNRREGKRVIGVNEFWDIC